MSRDPILRAVSSAFPYHKHCTWAGAAVVWTTISAGALLGQQRADTARTARERQAVKSDSALRAMPGMDMSDPAMRAMPGMDMSGGVRLQAATASTAKNAIHATPPKAVTYNWNVITLPGLVNPLRTEGSFDANVLEGKRVYFQNCVACHGPALDGKGRFANALTASPRQLTDPMFLPMHPEGYVFWRIAKGGWALPSLMEPWNSAMPAFEDILTEKEIWAVILFLYEQQGFKPGPWMWTEEQMKAGGAHVHIMQ
jgi:mono/diheme cytochrome c family protein